MDEREQSLLTACIGISILLHGAVLAFAPGRRPAPALEAPRVLEVVFRQAPTPGPEARARPDVLPVAEAVPAPRRKPVPRSPAPLVPVPAPDPAPVRDIPEAPQPSSAPAAAASPAAQTPAAPPSPSTAGQAALEPSSPPDFRAAYLRNPPPAYPASARRKREEGTVTLRVLVSDAGQPEKIALEHSSGSPALDLAALASVRRWRFAPARRGGAPHAAWVLVPIVFRLEPDE
jgi:protein TonB